MVVPAGRRAVRWRSAPPETGRAPRMRAARLTAGAGRKAGSPWSSRPWGTTTRPVPGCPLARSAPRKVPTSGPWRSSPSDPSESPSRAGRARWCTGPGQARSAARRTAGPRTVVQASWPWHGMLARDGATASAFSRSQGRLVARDPVAQQPGQVRPRAADPQNADDHQQCAAEAHRACHCTRADAGAPELQEELRRAREEPRQPREQATPPATRTEGPEILDR